MTTKVTTSVLYSIEKVTVYPDRAQVACGGSCTVEASTQQITFDDLPLSLEPDSVRVAGSGTARVRLHGVDINRKHYEQAPAASVRQLEAQIEAVEDEQRLLADAKAGWQAQMAHLDGLRQATSEYAKGFARGRMTVADQVSLANSLHDRDQEVRKELRAIDTQSRDLQRRLQKLVKELDALRAARPRQRYQAVVEVEVLAAGDFQPRLTYIVRQAGWQPLYDVRLVEDDNGRFLEIDALAQIKQNTGQDWTAVNLLVSTARPALNQRLPELKPWFIDEYKPAPPPQPRPRGKVKQARAMTAMADAMPEVAMAAPAAAEMVVAEVQDSGTAVSFIVPGKTDIPSDGSPHKTTLGQHRFDAQIDYLAIPKHTDAVYRRAKVVNASQGPLLAGQLNLFVDDAFIGRSRLDYTPTDGEIELLLGVEERLTIERELVKREVDKRRLRDERQLRYGYLIKLQNLMQTQVKLTVEDQIPVSRHEQIKVKLEEAQPTPVKQTELNLLKWSLQVDAEAKTSIRFEYSVQHPRSLDVGGLMD